MNDSSAHSDTAIRIAGGLRVCVPASVRFLTTYVLREQEDWFEDEMGFLRRHISPGARAIDIGANYGVYALTLAMSVGPDGRVWAVEPCSATAACLRKSIALNKLENISLSEVALSDHCGTAQLRLEANSELNAVVTDAEAIGASQQVPLMTLDSLVAERQCERVDFVKIDAEGLEEKIVAGGAGFLQAESPLVMYELKHGDHINHGLIESFERLGYSNYRLVPGLDILALCDPGQDFEPYQLNLFCCKEDRAAHLARAGVLTRTEDRSVPHTEPDSWWKNDLAQRPFAQSLRHRWAAARGDTRTARTDHEMATALYGAAHSGTNSAALRYNALRASFDLLVGLSETDVDVYRLCTLARVARELGERKRAVTALAQAFDLLSNQDTPAPAEPFLPPSAHFDALNPGNRFENWLIASIVDQYLSLATYSTYFAGAQSLRSLEMLHSTGFQRVAMERRRQLLRLLAGLQDRPLTDSRLSKYDAGNLNPDYWGQVQTDIPTGR